MIATAELVAIIEGLETVKNLREGMADYPGMDQTMRDEVLRFASEMEEEFVDMVREVDDPEEFPAQLALAYISWKTRWMKFNTKNQYRMIRTGESDPVDMWKSGAITNYIGAVEDLIPQEKLREITSFLMRPAADFASSLPQSA